MRIGDEVYIHGYVDEIRKDTIIIRNEGGYFGTVPSEVGLKVDMVDVLDKIRAEINSPNRGTCDYFIVDRIENIIDKYKAESEDGE